MAQVVEAQVARDWLLPELASAPRAGSYAGCCPSLLVRMPATCCLEGEAAFVLFLIMGGSDLDLVAADTGEPRELVEKLFARPSVNEAIRRWRSTAVCRLRDG